MSTSIKPTVAEAVATWQPDAATAAQPHTSQTPEQKLAALKEQAHTRLREAEKAWHAYFAECDVGGERIFASNVYEILRTATREAQP